MLYKSDPSNLGISLFIHTCLLSCSTKNNSMKYLITKKIEESETALGQELRDE